MRFSTTRPLVSLLLLGSALFFASCEEDPRFSAQANISVAFTDAPTGGPPQDTVSYWDGDNLGGKPSIKISLSEQTAYFYKSGMLVGISQLSTGREGLNTPAGQYSIIQKDIKPCLEQIRRLRRYQRQGDHAERRRRKRQKAAGNAFQRRANALFHAHRRRRRDARWLLPGYPASHGCIRMPEFMAENFFKSVDTGTPVTITN